MTDLQIATIGDATLVRGDCFQVAKLFDAASGKWRFDHFITDPPYEETMHKAKSGSSKRDRLRRDGGSKLRDLSFESVDAIRGEIVSTFAPLCDGWFIAFSTPEGVGRWADVINPSDALRYKRACFWVKPDSTPQLNGQGPAAGVECFVAAWGGQSYSSWNSGGKRNVYTHNIKSRSRDGRHETEKPVSLMTEIVDDFTRPGDVILDSFMGSGTTGVAAIARGRRFIGIERNPKFFEIACERLSEAWKQPRLFADAGEAMTVGRQRTGDMFQQART